MIADRALWVIERNTDQPLSLTGIAEACGISRSHLASAFASVTGVPVVRYLRGRRLTQAALKLADGAPDILDLALATGYGSHEAFTRAFCDQFGSTPEAVRESGSPSGIALVEPLELKARDLPVLAAPLLETTRSIKAVGLVREVRFDTVIEIPGQWRDFMSAYDEIDHPGDGIPIGLSWPAEDQGKFDYGCAAEVRSISRVPVGMRKIDIPTRLNAVFAHDGHVSTIFETYSAIWNTALPAVGLRLADGPVIERHNDAFDPSTGEGGLTLWVPVIQ